MSEEGWVPIQLLATFRRLQSLTTDMTLVMESITASTKLEVDPSGAQVRLKSGWQEWILSANRQAGGGEAAAPDSPTVPGTAPAATS